MMAVTTRYLADQSSLTPDPGATKGSWYRIWHAACQSFHASCFKKLLSVCIDETKRNSVDSRQVATAGLAESRDKVTVEHSFADMPTVRIGEQRSAEVLGGNFVPRQALGIARRGSRHRDDRGAASCQAEPPKTFRPPMIGESQPSRLFHVNVSTKDSELVFGHTQNLMNKIAHPAVRAPRQQSFGTHRLSQRYACHNPFC
jgi:hypothetical protein